MTLTIRPMNRGIIVHYIVHDIDYNYTFTCSSSNFRMVDSPVLTGEADKEIVFEWLRNEYSNYGRVFLFSMHYVIHYNTFFPSLCTWIKRSFRNGGGTRVFESWNSICAPHFLFPLQMDKRILCERTERVFDLLKNVVFCLSVSFANFSRVNFLNC